MPYKMPLTTALLAAVCLPLPTLAQHASPSSKPNATPVSAHTQYTMKAYSRMVTLDVVVENRKGRHIRGLKAGDFQIYEQTPSESNKKRLQRIADLQEIHTAALRPPAEAPTNLAPGVYTNAVRVQKDPVPPTVLLVDGINTQLRYQAQVHVQMLKMLRQLPANVPIAVLLMGDRLRMLQSFTTNHELVEKALAKAESATGQELEHLNPKDDPNAVGNLFYGLSGRAANNAAGMIAAAQEFDQLVYAANMTERFSRTYNAFLSIAQSLEGYPGRKNVLWLSTSFPLTLNSFMNPNNPYEMGKNLARLNYWKQMRVLNNALSNAKIAVYPVDIGGVRNLQVFSAEARPVDPFATSTPATPGGYSPTVPTSEDAKRVQGAASRQIQMWNVEENTMHAIAKDTGGKVCIGDNNLAKCVHKAVHDSSDFYEISYYPNSGDWNGEYRRIILKVKRHGARLSYRRGYYANPEASPDSNTQAAAMRKDCGELLNATGIVFTAKTLPSKKPGRLKFELAIDPSNLTFSPTASGQQQLNLEVGVCTYNRRGWSQKLMAYPLNLSLNASDYHALMAGGKVRGAIYVPGPKPSAIRLLVKDVPSGKLGSIYIRTEKPKVGK